MVAQVFPRAVYLTHTVLFFVLYLLKAGVGSCCLLGSAVISGV